MIILKLAKNIGFYLLFLILIIFICSLLNLIGVNSTITDFILFIFNIILFLVYGFKNGISANKKGFLAGIKISLILLAILIIINLITIRNIFNITSLIYYLILLLTGTFGGMLGISKKKEEN